VHIRDILARTSADSGEGKPGLKEVEPFKTALSGNREEIAKLTTPDLEKILAATLTGMRAEEFKAEGTKWLDTARHPRWNRSLH
jgi:hypothetical protein